MLFRSLLPQNHTQVPIGLPEWPVPTESASMQEREETRGRIGSLEARLGTAEMAIQEVKQNTAEILRILQSK